MILLALRISISAALITYLMFRHFENLQAIISILKSVNITMLLLGLASHAFVIVITAVRWKTLLATQDVRLGTGTITLSVLIGFFFNNILPTSIGGDVFRTYDIAKKGSIPVETSASVILVERFSGVVSAAIYAIAAVFLGFTAIGGQSLIIPIVIFFCITAIVGFLILNPSILRLGRLFDRFKVLGKIRGRLINVYNTFLSFKQYKFRLMMILSYSFLLQFAIILNYYFIGRALGIDLGLTAFLFISPIVATVSMIPVSIGGIGIRENTLAFMLVSMGVDNEAAGTHSLLVLFMLILIGITGGIIYLARPFFSEKTGGRDTGRKRRHDNSHPGQP
jgi:glycosyltransferase 2 family protein